MNHNREMSFGQQMSRLDQMAWEAAARSHAVYLDCVRRGVLVEPALKRIAEIEARYPQLGSQA